MIYKYSAYSEYHSMKIQFESDYQLNLMEITDYLRQICDKRLCECRKGQNGPLVKGLIKTDLSTFN